MGINCKACVIKHPPEAIQASIFIRQLFLGMMLALKRIFLVKMLITKMLGGFLIKLFFVLRMLLVF